MPAIGVQIWQNTNNDKFLCTQSSGSTKPCTFSLYPCDGINQRGENYYISIPQNSGYSSLSVTIVVNTTAKNPTVLSTSFTSYDSLAVNERKEYVLPFDASTLQFLMINFRYTSASYSSASVYLSPTQNFGDAQPLSYGYSSSYSYPGIAWIHAALCKQSQINATRALGTTARMYATLYAGNGYATPQYSIESTVITGTLPIITLTASVPQSVTLQPGQVQFLKFTPSVDRNVSRKNKIIKI